MPAYVTQFDLHPWDGRSVPAPQLILQVDARKPERERRDLTEREKAFAARLFDASADATEPFGGFSGGPVILAGTDGESLIGIVKERRVIYGEQRTFATAWDDFVTGFTTSRAWVQIAKGTGPRD